MIKQVTVDAYFCDFCGVQLPDDRWGRFQKSATYTEWNGGDEGATKTKFQLHFCITDRATVAAGQSNQCWAGWQREHQYVDQVTLPDE